MTVASRTAVNADRRALPPYGRQLADLLASGRAPRHGVLVHAGRWPRGQSRVFAELVVPPGERPGAYRWDVCHDLDVLVRHEGVPLDLLAELVRELLACSPRRLRVLEDRGDVYRVAWVKTSRGIELEELTDEALGHWLDGRGAS